jgi:2,5-diketo-D-gluconate reductase A
VNAVPDVMLNNGRTIPQFGFGVFQVKPEDTVEAVSTALQTGYRHLDTAEMYGNRQVWPGPRRRVRDQQTVQRRAPPG